MVCNERSPIREYPHTGEVESNVITRSRSRVKIPLSELGKDVRLQALGELTHMVGNVNVRPICALEPNVKHE